MTTLLHVNTQHAHLPTDAQAKQFAAIVKEFGGQMDGASDKGVYVRLADASQTVAFTKRIQATFKNVWVDATE